MDLSIIPNCLLYKINRDVFNINDIELYIKALIEFLELEDYYNGIIVSDDRNGNLASYNFETMKIRIYYDMLVTEGMIEAKYINHANITLVTNMLIIHSIIHEVMHIYQKACFNEKNIPIFLIYKQQLEYSEKCNDQDYQKYYSRFIFEREAETIALENCLRIIRFLVPDTELFIYYLNLLKTSIENGYKKENERLLSPLDTMYEEVFKTDTPIITTDDAYDSLKLGIPVSKRQYTLFKRNYKDIIIDKNNLQV